MDQRHLDELDAKGYTVVPDAAPPELFAAVRTRILELAEEAAQRAETTVNFGDHTQMVYKLLAKGRVFEEAIFNPTLVALMTHLLGVGYTLSVMSGSVVRQGATHGPLHCDNIFIPDPFPPIAQIATAVFCCDDFTEANGSTHLVPESHLLLRHPQPGDRKRAIAIEAPANSIVAWNGGIWHSSGARTGPGERVVLHTAFCRIHLRAYESYDGLIGPEVFERNPPALQRLVGADLPWAFTGAGPDPDKLAAAHATTTGKDFRVPMS